MANTTATRRQPPSLTDVAEAEVIVERAGYKPELRRSLRFFSMFAIAFSIISITTGIRHPGRPRPRSSPTSSTS